MHDLHATPERPCGTQVEAIPSHELDRLEEIIGRYGGRSRYLIPALKDAQEMFGYLPKEVQHRLAGGLNVPASRVFGVVTFYSFFTTTPRGRHTVRICLGTACYVKGSTRILETVTNGNGLGFNGGSTSEDGRFTVEPVRCLGTCGLAPVIMIDADVHGNISPSNIIKHFDNYS